MVGDGAVAVGGGENEAAELAGRKVEARDQVEAVKHGDD